MEDTPGVGTQPAAGPTRKKGRGLLWAFLAVVIAFGAGYLWQYFEAGTIRDQLADVEQELAVERFRVRLGQATLAAQAGDFEAARAQMSGLFDALQADVGTLPPEIQGVANDFLARRDDIITGLSRSNPAYADVLFGMLERLGTVVQRADAGATPPPATSIEPETAEEAPVPETEQPDQPEPGSP